MGPWLDDATWQLVQASVPILCVDIVPFKIEHGMRFVGLIEREYPGGRMVWCHLGGRVNYGETVAEAIDRHVSETLEGAGLRLDPDPQPTHVQQWFPADVRTGVAFGEDPRKHAVSLCFALDLGMDLSAKPGGEGARFDWFSDIPPTLWPGTARVLCAAAGALPNRDGEIEP